MNNSFSNMGGGWSDNPNIRSAQSDIHSDLPRVLARHQGAAFQKPYTEYNRAAFTQFMQAWAERQFAPLIVDAGCGVGESTLHIARAHPQAFVVGVDQSEDRLTTHKTWWRDQMPDNFIWIRADLADFWRLLHDELARRGERLYKHFILYPNPWPKIGHLQRRWHGHAVFPTMVALGGTLECRSNWPVYVREFAFAVRHVTGVEPESIGQLPIIEPITPFERKYHARGEPLFVCRFELPSRLPLCCP